MQDNATDTNQDDESTDCYTADTSHKAALPGVTTTSDFTDLLMAVKNARRRHVLHILAADGSLTVGDIVDQVTARETGHDDFETSERRAVYVGLYQRHLGHLDDHSIIEWDGSSMDDVTPGERFDRALAVLEAAEAAYQATERISTGDAVDGGGADV